MKHQISIVAFLAGGLGLLGCGGEGEGQGPGDQEPAVQPVQSRLVVANRVSVAGRQFFGYLPQEREPVKAEEALARAGRLLEATGSKGFQRAAEEEKLLGTAIALRNPDDSSASFRLDLLTDRILFNQGLAAYRALADTPGLPSQQAAPSLALRQIQALGLLPPREELVLAHIGGLNMGEAAQGQSRIFQKLRTVRFDRKLGDLPVVGKSRLVVHLGESGRLVGLVRDWVPVKARPLDPSEVLTDPEVQESIERRLKEDLTADEVVVDRSDIVLWDRGGGVMEPAVRLQGRKLVSSPERGEFPYDSVVPLLRRPSLKYPFMRDPRLRQLLQPESAAGGGAVDDGKDD
jgi:hypothetical protein